MAPAVGWTIFYKNETASRLGGLETRRRLRTWGRRTVWVKLKEQDNSRIEDSSHLLSTHSVSARGPDVFKYKQTTVSSHSPGKWGISWAENPSSLGWVVAISQPKRNRNCLAQTLGHGWDARSHAWRRHAPGGQVNLGQLLPISPFSPNFVRIMAKLDGLPWRDSDTGSCVLEPAALQWRGLISSGRVRATY